MTTISTTKRKQYMNAAHIVGKKRNRISRLNRRISDKELTAEQRNQMSARVSELTQELSRK
jgi:hypothetical protein